MQGIKIIVDSFLFRHKKGTGSTPSCMTCLPIGLCKRGGCCTVIWTSQRAPFHNIITFNFLQLKANVYEIEVPIPYFSLVFLRAWQQELWNLLNSSSVWNSIIQEWDYMTHYWSSMVGTPFDISFYFTVVLIKWCRTSLLILELYREQPLMTFLSPIWTSLMLISAASALG